MQRPQQACRQGPRQAARHEAAAAGDLQIRAISRPSHKQFASNWSLPRPVTEHYAARVVAPQLAQRS
jgi:hypothetical protein